MVRTCPISLRWPPVQRSQREADSGFRIKSLDGRETVISASQCRSTLEALAEIKARPVFIARRANIVHGPQQVNNGVAANNAQTPARAEETESLKTELLGASDGERLDTGTASAAGRSDSALATVGEIDGATNRRG